MQVVFKAGFTVYVCAEHFVLVIAYAGYNL